MCLAQVRGHECEVYATHPDEEEDDAENSEVALTDKDGGAGEAIDVLARIFDENVDVGRIRYCDWASLHGTEIVNALAQSQTKQKG